MDWLKQNKDKVEHSIASCGIYFIALHIFKLVPFAILLALLAGVFKETFDDRWDWWDIAANIVGIGVGVCLTFV